MHPLRGGFKYRCKLFIDAAHKALNIFEKNGLSCDVYLVLENLGPVVCEKMAEYEDEEEYMDAIMDELVSDAPNKFEFYYNRDLFIYPEDMSDEDELDEGEVTAPDETPTLRLSARYDEVMNLFLQNSKRGVYICVIIYLLALRFLLKKHYYLAEMILAHAFTPTEEDDDGGPVIYKTTQVTWDQLVWTMLIELFGSNEQARMVLEFLALGLSTDSNGRLVMFLHGQSTNGKSMFLELVNKMFGKDNLLVRHLPSNFFTSKSDQRMDATFRYNAEEVRFVIESEMPILDMDEGGRRKFKQYTGGDTVANRQPYDHCNNDFILTSKFLTASNDLPYIPLHMSAEQKRIMIVPALSTFIQDRALLRRNLIGNMVADRYCRLFFNVEYPRIKLDYVVNTNQQANTMFPQDNINLHYKKICFPQYYQDILSESFIQTIKQPARFIPTQRWLVGNRNYVRPDFKEKMGAALCRILLEHVVPSMGGLKDSSKTVNKLETYVSDNQSLFASYKKILYAILKKLVVQRKGYRVLTHHLRVQVQEELSVQREAIRGLLFGRYRNAGSEAFEEIDSAVKSDRSFCYWLRECNFDLTTAKDGVQLNDFQYIEEFLDDRAKRYISPIELLLREDLKKYASSNLYEGPSEHEVERTRRTCRFDPAVARDLVYGSRGSNEKTRGEKRGGSAYMILKAKKRMVVNVARRVNLL